MEFCVEAIMIVGRYLKMYRQQDWKDFVLKLNTIDWSRSNKTDWLGRSI